MNVLTGQSKESSRVSAVNVKDATYNDVIQCKMKDVSGHTGNVMS